ncbi:MAG: hypothetical protein WC467_03280 [Patescibacteria group bacterium]
MKRQKINVKSQVIMTALLLVAGIFVFAYPSQAAVGLQVGTSTLILNSGENLIFGNLSASSNAGANLFLLQNASLPKFLITSSGNVGIGASAVNDIFSIGDGTNAAPAGSDKTGHNFTNTYLSTDDYALTNYGIVKSLISTATGSILSLWNGTLNGNIWNGAAGAGNVGIGTTTPNYKLVVAGDTYFKPVAGGDFRINYEGGGIEVSGLKLYTGTNPMIFQSNYGGPSLFSFNYGNTPRMVIRQDGNVGIGTTNPTSKLHIYSSGNATASYVQSGYTPTVADNSQIRGLYNYFSLAGANNATHSTDANLHAYLSNINTGTLTYWSGLRSEISNESSGTIASARNNTAYIRNISTGIITNAYGNYVETFLNSGTGSIGTIYGLYVNSQTAGATDNYAIYTNGTTKSYFGGNVGVGTAVPNDIFSIGNAGSAPAGSDKTGHNFTNTYLSTDDYALTNYGIVKSLISTATGSILSLWNGTLNGNIWNGAAGAGNVGIGTTTPTYKLEVAGGDIGIDAGQYYRIKRGGDNVSIPVLGFSAGTNNLVLKTGGSGDTSSLNIINSASVGLMTILNGGNVGIGTTTPTQKMEIGGNILINSTNKYLYFGDTSAGIGRPVSGRLGLFIGSEYLSILTGGNVGIGTTAPNDKFSIGNAGSAPAGSGATGHNYTNTYLASDDYALANYGLVKTMIDTATSSSALWGGAIGTAIWSLNSGNVGVGTSTPTQKMEIVGTFKASASSSSILLDANGNFMIGI